MKTKKLLYFSLPVSLPLLGLSAVPTYAICPVCVIAIGAGLGLSEYLGIDDTIAGLWIGAMLISMTIWTIDWLNRKKWSLGNKKIRDILILIAYYGLTLWSLWEKGFIGQTFHQLWGIDKLILGITIGTLVIPLTTLWYNKIKKANNNHAQFPFQKVVMPIVILLVLSLTFYFITSF